MEKSQFVEADERCCNLSDCFLVRCRPQFLRLLERRHSRFYELRSCGEATPEKSIDSHGHYVCFRTCQCHGRRVGRWWRWCRRRKRLLWPPLQYPSQQPDVAHKRQELGKHSATCRIPSRLRHGRTVGQRDERQGTLHEPGTGSRSALSSQSGASVGRSRRRKRCVCSHFC